ncbi:MAG: hypothetical protein Q7S22_04920 [Candidatus Micrarchaeota archaeon]|nr:hypothetical protein [Candidatus Micrarchaeota archaeon]
MTTKIAIFGKLLLVSLAIALVTFALLPEAGFLFLTKIIAFGIAISIASSLIYPELRGVKKGDPVSVVTSSSIPALIGRVGRALSNGKKSSEIRVRFDNGEEAMGIIEGYAGFISPPKVRILYEERINE